MPKIKVEVLKTFRSARATYHPGDVVEMESTIAVELEANQLVKKTTKKKTETEDPKAAAPPANKMQDAPSNKGFPVAGERTSAPPWQKKDKDK